MGATPSTIVVENQTDIELHVVVGLAGIECGRALLGATAPGTELPACAEIQPRGVNPDIFFNITLFFSEFHANHSQYRTGHILCQDMSFSRENQSLVVYFGTTGELKLAPRRTAMVELRERDTARVEGRVRMRVHCPKCRITLLSPEGATRFRCHSCFTALSLPDYARPGASSSPERLVSTAASGLKARDCDKSAALAAATKESLDAQVEEDEMHAAVRGNPGGNFEGYDDAVEGLVDMDHIATEAWF